MIQLVQTQQRPDNTAAEEAAWLAVASGEKATSVIKLASDHVREIVEIGAGTGAVLEALDERGFAETYWACEPSKDLAAEIPDIPRLSAVATVAFEQAFAGRRFDLAILSHVLEHLLSPAVLLAEALERADYVLVEVPIEGNRLGNSRAWLKERLGSPRLDNPAGHVQFFSRGSARALVRHAGGVVLAEHGYFPRAPYSALAEKPYQRAVLAAARFELLARHYYEHFAMLCSKRSIEGWQHIYAQPE